MICIANKNVLKYEIPRDVCGVYMIKNKITNDFYIGSSVYITENTNYKGKNKTSKIKAVCDGERTSAYGYQWEYNKV